MPAGIRVRFGRFQLYLRYLRVKTLMRLYLYAVRLYVGWLHVRLWLWRRWFGFRIWLIRRKQRKLIPPHSR
jgi:hypothetical protein